MIRPDDMAPLAPTTACKVCGRPASLYGVTDFNKSCEEQRGKLLPLTGVPIYYHQCGSCRLVFTASLDHWDKRDYVDHIYNERYVDVDPDYVEVRPRENAHIVRTFLRNDTRVRHLDYGGGNGSMSRLLAEHGIDSSTWDPMDMAASDPTGTFGLVTAFEVFEHTPLPIETLREIMGFCDATEPLVFFSTYTIDALPPRCMDFWYIAPRNGHITVHTEGSLQALFAPTGLQVHHFGNGWHLAYRTLPAWVDLELFSLQRSTLHRIVIALGLHRKGRLRRGLRRLAASFRESPQADAAGAAPPPPQAAGRSSSRPGAGVEAPTNAAHMPPSNK